MRDPSTDPPKAMFQLSGFYYIKVQDAKGKLQTWVLHAWTSVEEVRPVRFCGG